jgi:hypothetical protein
MTNNLPDWHKTGVNSSARIEATVLRRQRQHARAIKSALIAVSISAVVVMALAVYALVR